MNFSLQTWSSNPRCPGSKKDGFGRASPSNNAGFREEDSILVFVKKAQTPKKLGFGEIVLTVTAAFLVFRHHTDLRFGDC